NSKIVVAFGDGRSFEASGVVAFQRDADIAILQIPATGLKALTVGDDKSVHAGQHVVAIGNPRGFTNTVSDGLVSTFRDRNGVRLIQVSAPISPGSSGGPLFDDHGDVIGLTTLGVTNAQNLA